jgi:hypothetical protein
LTSAFHCNSVQLGTRFCKVQWAPGGVMVTMLHLRMVAIAFGLVTGY